MALKRIGNVIVLEGASKYIADTEKVNKAIEKTNKTIMEQAEAAKKAALPDQQSIVGRFASIGKAAANAVTLPFRMITGVVKGVFNSITGIATGMMRLMGNLMVNTLKTVIVSLIARQITSWIFGGGNAFGGAGTKAADAFAKGFSSISKYLPTSINNGLKNLSQWVAPHAKKFGEAFVKYGKPFFEGQLGGMLGDAFKISGGVQGNVAGKISDMFLNFASSKAPDAAKAATNIGNSFQGMVQKVGGVPGVMNKITASLSGITGAAKSAVGGGISKLATGMGGLAAAAGPVVLAIGAVVAALVAIPAVIGGVKKAFDLFMSFGQRGAGIQGIAEAFDYAAAASGQASQTMLKNMREASAGMVSDVDLMKRTNLALAGATGEVAIQMGEKLPQLLLLARAQARATGQDVNYLFESLVTGVKRSSPMLIDNTGLVLKIGQANEKMAQSLGKSVEALTDQEKQIAVLNATLEAGADAIARLGEAEMTAAEVQAQITAARANTMDTIAAAVQPLYVKILEFKLKSEQAILGFVRMFAPISNALAKFAGTFIDIFMKIRDRIIGVFNPIVNELRYVVFFVVTAINLMTDYIKFLYEAFERGAELVGAALQIVTLKLMQIFPFLGVFKEGLFKGAASAFGAFAAGALHAFNTTIAPAIIAIATFIADFLIGESPPPRGPLSQIDKGGANVMQAWLDGFAGVSMEPVSRVAQEVIDRMGPVARMTLDQVKMRLAALDTELQPFQDRLDLVVAKLQAMTAPFEKAKDIVAKRLDAAVKLLTQGGGDANTVRALDKQMELINQRLSAAEDETALAELQLTLAQSRQAEERAALAIQERMLGITEEITDKAAGSGDPESAAKDAVEKAAGGGGGKPDLPPAPGGGGGARPMGGSSLDSILGLDSIKAAGAELGGAFMESFSAGGGIGELASLGQHGAALQTQMGRIQQGAAGFPARIAGAFTGIPDALAGQMQPIIDKVTEFFGEDSPLVDVLTGENSIFNRWKNMLTGDKNIFAVVEETIAGRLASLFTVFNTNIGLESVLGLLLTGAESIFDIFGLKLSGEESPLNVGLAAITESFTTLFGEGGTIPTALDTAYTLMDATLGRIQAAFALVFTDPASVFQLLPQTVQDIITRVLDIFRAFAGEGDGSLTQALSTLGALLRGALVAPIVGAFNSVKDALANVLQTAVRAVWGAMPAPLRSLVAAVTGDLSNFGVSIPDVTYHKGGEVKATLLEGEGVLSIPAMKMLTRLEKKLPAMPVFTPPNIVPGNTTNVRRSNDVIINGPINYNGHPSPKKSIAQYRAMQIMTGGS